MEKQKGVEAASRLINSDKVANVYMPFYSNGFNHTEYVAVIIDGEDEYVVRVICERPGQSVAYYLTIENNNLKLFSGYTETDDGEQLLNDIRKQFVAFEQKRKEEKQIKAQKLEAEREKKFNSIFEKF